jgi:glycosyltransferase involved in cell wall biosynthesis
MCPHYVRRLFEILARNHNVDFYFTGGHESYWHKENQLKIGQFNGIYLPGFFLGSKFKITPRLFNLGWKKCDAVIKTIDDRFAILFAFFAAKLHRKPFILWTGLWAHPQTTVHKLSFGLTKFIYRRSDAIITYGEHVRTYLIGLGIKQEKIFCSPHATDNAVYNRSVSDAEKKDLRGRLNLKEGQAVVLYVGRLEDGKGLEYLTEAMANIGKKASLLVVGTGSKRDDLQRVCSDKGISTVFAGHVANEDLYLYYAAADIFVLPSVTTAHFKEPWGIVINEAMNQSCAIVTTNAVGAAAGGLVEDGINGFIVPERDASALTDALNHLIDDAKLRGQFSKAANLKIKGWTSEVQAHGFDQALNYVARHH